MSSEPESSTGGHGQTSNHQTELQGLEENETEKHRTTSYLKRVLMQNRDNLYSFKGFMFFCFGVPGVSPNWCSKYMPLIINIFMTSL